MEPGRKSVLKLQNGDTEQSVMMFEETAPVGTVTPLHLHHDSDEVAYVLSGEITFKIGDEITVGGPGTWAFMRRAVSHEWKSTGAEPRPCAVSLHAGSRRRPEGSWRAMSGVSLTPDDGEFVRIAERHGWEIVGPPPF
jgi:quercetin dioxygenase-like cupin family protein